ncbi:PREDICTED: uncharacterized protein LOC101309103 [Fragaria vesca subsp. vesca]
MAAFIEGLAKRFVTDGLKGVAEKLEHQSAPDVKLNSVAPLPLDDETAHNLCPDKSMEGALKSQVNHACVPSAPPLSVNSSLEINEYVVEQSPSLGAHETIHTSSLTASLNTSVTKETEISECSGSSTVLNTNEISQSPKYPVRYIHPIGGIVQLVATVTTSLTNLKKEVVKAIEGELGTWGAAISYEACVRLCLHAWANHYSTEVHCFLENECALLRDAFGFPDSLGDDLIIAVQDSKRQHCGHARAQVSAIADKPGDKLRWWPIYTDLELEPVGRIQLCMEYSTNPDDNHHVKFGSIAETAAYDYVFVAAVKFQHCQQRSFLIDGPWNWLLTEFASYFGISKAYTKLRHLSFIMDVATPTNDCLTVVHDMLSDILIMKGNITNQLSPLENHMLVKILDQVNQTLALVFENYKSLEEDSPSGMMNIPKPASGLAAPALGPAFQLYSLLHDFLLSPEAQMKLCRYFRVAAKKRLRMHFVETDNLILSSNDGTQNDSVTSYQRMNSLVSSIRNEILTDLRIQNQNILPSFLDLPNISSSIYNVELCSRLHAFLVACPPSGLSPPVAELIIATAEFQRDLSLWNINPVDGGVNAKELFHSHIVSWIENKHQALLDRCKQDKENWSEKETQNETTPFIHATYNQLMDTLHEYEIISSHLPMYTSALEIAIADVENAVAKTLERRYSNVLSPLKDNLRNKVLGNKYLKKLSNQTIETYSVPAEVGIVFNSMKCMIDVMWPNIEAKFESWLPCVADDGYTRGEHLNDATVLLRTKYRNYRRAIVEKLAKNARVQAATKLKNIMRDSKEVESEVRIRMQPLEDLLQKEIDNLSTVANPTVCVEICHEFWDRTGQDVLRLLEDRRSRSWYKGLRVAVSIVDDIFGSEMQRLCRNSLKERDMAPPESIKEVHSILDQDAAI